jgi:predicted aconitase
MLKEAAHEHLRRKASAMVLTYYEKTFLDGREGPARQKVMEFLVKHAGALGAERFIETNNVITAIVTPALPI